MSGRLTSTPPTRDLIAESRERFIAETSEHEMDVLRHDGLYRHVRFQKPGTTTYYFDLVTWPGYLAIAGDCGDFVFSRVRDMFEFFAGHGSGNFEDPRWGINPGYWSEKLQAPRVDASLRFSYEKFQSQVEEWFANVSEELEPADVASLREALNEQVLADWLRTDDAHEAHRLVSEFDHDGLRIYDSWEWDVREYDYRFLWCCWAIVWGISRYRAATSQASVDQ